MSLVTQAFLFERYGCRMDLDALARELGWSKGTIYNMLSAGTFPVKTYLDGKQRFADFQDVAAYLDTKRREAA